MTVPRLGCRVVSGPPVVGGPRRLLTPRLRRPHRGQATPRPEAGGRMRSKIVTLVYLVVGVLVAASHHYFAHASTLKPLLSALLAVVLWPLLLLGINLHIK
jgi:hypothetical protein